MRDFDYWKLLGDPAWTDDMFVELGHQNLSAIIVALRKEERHGSQSMRNLEDDLTALAGKTRESLMEEADFSVDVGSIVSALSLPGVVNSLDTFTREYGHTTFTQCGSCAHKCSSGSDGVGCGFYNHIDWGSQAAPYYSPCLLLKPGELERVRKELEEKLGLERAVRECNNSYVRSYISCLLALKRRAPHRPLLPLFRDPVAGPYRYGDRVLMYTGDPTFGENQNRWAFATVLRQDNQVVAVLDVPLLPPDSHRRQDWVNQEFGRILWSTYARSPFIMTARELRVLGNLSPQNPLRLLWKGCAADWRIGNERTHDVWEADADEFNANLSMDRIIHSARTDGRLMSAREAASILGFKSGDWPTTAEQVVSAFRYLQGARTVPDIILKRAKNTLLLRVHGSTEVAG